MATATEFAVVVDKRIPSPVSAATDQESMSAAPTAEPQPENGQAETPPAVDGQKLEEEKEEEIFPDHYYEGGKIPVFKPVSCFV